MTEGRPLTPGPTPTFYSPAVPAAAVSAPALSIDRERHRAEQRQLALPRVEPGVLHHYGHVGADEAGVVGVARHRFGIGEVVEPQVRRTAGRDNHAVRPYRFAVGE